MRHTLFTIVVVAALGGACATSPAPKTSTTDAEAASLKSQKDRTACLKMCEMAGAAEDKSDEVAACQAQCPTDAVGADTAP